MSSWTLEQPPYWFPDAVATSRGWENPTTGEVLVAIRSHDTRAGAPDVVRVENVSTTSILKAGDKLSFLAYFNEKVTITGTPRLHLTVNGTSKFANYVSGSTTSQILFEWTVVNETATAGQVVMVDTVYGHDIDLNGGTIKDAEDEDSALTFSLVDLSAVVIDTTAPTISTLAFTGGTSDGTVLIATLATSTAVTVTGTPRIPLTIGGSATKYATYVSGSGTTSLVFNYTIENGLYCIADPATGLVIGANLDLNGGTAADLAGNNLVLTLPDGGQASIAITDTVAPTISSISLVPVAGVYHDADLWRFNVTFSEIVDVVGTPRLTVVIGANTRYANYSAGTGTAVLTFEYTIVAGDATTGLGQVNVTALGLNSGTIKDPSLNAAVLTFAAPNTANITVDNTAPTVTGFDRMDGTYVSGQTLTIPVIFSEQVVVTGSPRIAISISGVSKYATYSYALSPTILAFTYLVVIADVANAGQFTIASPIDLNSGTIKDVVGNAATLTFSVPTTTGVVII